MHSRPFTETDYTYKPCLLNYSSYIPRNKERPRQSKVFILQPFVIRVSELFFCNYILSLDFWKHDSSISVILKMFGIYFHKGGIFLFFFSHHNLIRISTCYFHFEKENRLSHVPFFFWVFRRRRGRGRGRRKEQISSGGIYAEYTLCFYMRVYICGIVRGVYWYPTLQF